MKLNCIAPAVAALAVAFTITSARADSIVPKSYPLQKCVVSDEKIGEHGKPVKVIAPDGTAVYLCCKDCVKDFKKDPEKYSKMVKDAAKKK